jgi:hypothetical protein
MATADVATARAQLAAAENKAEVATRTAPIRRKRTQPKPDAR